MNQQHLNADAPADRGPPRALNIEDPPLVFHASRLKSLLIIVLLVPLACFVTGLALNVLQGVAKWLALMVVFAFGFLSIRMFRNLFRIGPVVIVDQVGVEDVRWPFGIIAWEDIIEIKTDGGNWDRLIVHVADEDLIMSTLPTLLRWHFKYLRMRGLPVVRIDFTGLHPSSSRLFEYMALHDHLHK